MADSGGNQRIDLKAPPPTPIEVRPLKTGAEFTLVLPQPRFIQKAWDKALYSDGEEAQLLIKGKHLGAGPFTLIIETEKDGGWSEVDRVSAPVSGGTEAKATYKFPAKQKLAAGHFTKAEWDKLKAMPGDTFGVHVEAEGLEGEWILLRVEKELDDGSWENLDQWDAHIQGGKYDGQWKSPVLERPVSEPVGGTISLLKFADKHLKAGETAWLQAKCEGMDGDSLHFELEREVGPGKWETVGHASSTIKSGEAKAGIGIPKGKKLEDVGTVQTAAFEGKVVPGQEVTCAVTTLHMDGQKVDFSLDIEINGRWVEHDIGEGTVGSDKAICKFELPALPAISLPEAPKEELVSAHFDPKLEIGKAVTLDIVTKGMDGQTLTVILEAAEGGEWVPVAETTAHVKGDKASASVVVPAPVRLMAQAVAAGFEKQQYKPGEDLVLVLDSVGLDGELADLSIEEEQPDGTFREVAKDRALLKQGPVKVKLAPPPPQGKAGAGPPAPPSSGAAGSSRSGAARSAAA